MASAGGLGLAQDTIVYGVVPRNFGPHGFRSVTAKLNHLRDLGINALWLSPVNATPSGDFGYAVTDYFKLRPDYGTETEFRTLVQEAHAQGIRVFMDFVPNHTSEHHPYFLDAQARGSASPYYNHFARDEQGDPTHYFEWTHLPNLNYDNPAVRSWMLEAFSYWVREFDVDGFRVDVAWGIKERAPDFWPEWSARLRQTKPGVVLLAEASARDPYYITHGFDAAYDWNDELGHWAWERVFENQGTLVHRLHAALTNEGRDFAPGSVIFRFLNNNDTGPRFISRYGLGMTRVAAALLLTLPGMPCIYTGDEVGAEYQPYETATTIAWDDAHGLLLYYRKLIALRKSIPSLRSPWWQPVEVSGAGQVYAYIRYLEAQDLPVLVVLNFASKAREPELQIPEQFKALTQAATLRDMLVDEHVPIAGSSNLRISMPAATAKVLLRAE